VSFLKRLLPQKKKHEEIAWELFGDQNPEVLVLGHSHRTTMAVALKNIKTSKKISVLKESSGPYKIPHPDTGYWNFALNNRISGLKKIVIIWQGHLSIIDFIFSSEQPFKLVNNNNISDIWINDDLDINSIVFERDVINSFEKNFCNDGLNEIVRMYKENNYEIFILSSPPPKSKSFINTVLHNEIFFKEIYENISKNSTIPLNEIILEDTYRARIWSLMEKALQNTARDTGAKFIPIPKEFMTDQGILLEQYYHNDVSHANEIYSEKLWNYLIENEVL
jgi:hypothetical protein